MAHRNKDSLADLRCKNSEYEDTIKQLRKKIKNFSIFEDIFFSTLIILFMIVVFFIPIYKYVGALNVVTSCYVVTGNVADENSSLKVKNSYMLYGNIEWRIDRIYGRYSSMDEAIIVANKLGCKIK
jgi:cell division protein FtsL